jgi:RNA polymerase sigma factor (sigma-70 family)
LTNDDLFTRPEALVRRVYAYAAYRLGAGPDAEDATHDTFERAWRYRSRYDRSKGEPVAWLLGIARNCVDDVAQGRHSHAELDVETPGAEQLEPDAIRRLDLRTALLELDERSRELLALRYGADLTARQIAELLGQKTNAVEVALHRALARLRAVMDKDVPSQTDENAVWIGQVRKNSL